MRQSLIALTTLALVAGCGGSNTGKVALSMTDAPSDLTNVSHVNITIDEIRVHDDGTTAKPTGGAADAGAAQDGVDGEGWLVLCTDTETLDLMALTNGRFSPLCSTAATDGGVATADAGTGPQPIEVPAGNISQLRLHVIKAELVFNDGTPTAQLDIPSGAQSGLKINIDRKVDASSIVDIKLDFDAAQSISKLANGTYKMAPVIRVLN